MTFSTHQFNPLPSHCTVFFGDAYRFQEQDAENAECQDSDGEEYWSQEDEEPAGNVVLSDSSDDEDKEMTDGAKSVSTHCKFQRVCF